MHDLRRRLVVWLGLLALLLGSPMAMAATDTGTTTGGQAQADMLAWHRVGLSDPVVIYVFGAQDKLLRVLGADGKNGFAQMKTMRAMIASGAITAAADVAPGTGARLLEFLDTQGIARVRVLGGDTPYHLVVAVPDTGNAPCPPCENYRAMLAEATNSPAARGKFSVFTLKLGAPGMEMRVVE